MPATMPVSLRRAPRLRELLLAAALLGSAARAAGHAAEAAAPGKLPLLPPGAAIELDGRLDESAWAGALTLPLAFEVDPAENAPATVTSELLLLADRDALYAAFRCHDADPAAIRAHFTARDDIWADDFVNLTVDPFGDRQRGYRFGVNARGVQADAILDELRDGDAKILSEWDAVWRAATRIHEGGWTAELRIPLAAFPRLGGEASREWAVEGLRVQPRALRRVLLTNPLPRDQRCRLCQAVAVQARVAGGAGWGVIPTLTASSRDATARDASEARPGASAHLDLGRATRLDLGGQPDFSHLEADAAQLLVNRRFALSVPEKRPLFLEGLDLLATPLAVVHTRAIVEPAGVGKLTHQAGARGAELILARDESPQLLLPGRESSTLLPLPADVTSTIARARLPAGERWRVGTVATDRRGGGYANTVAGLDATTTLGEAGLVELQALGSWTEYPLALAGAHGQPGGRFQGGAWSASLRHSGRTWQGWASHRALDSSFRADLGFLPQVDDHRTTAGGSRSWWGDGSRGFTLLQLGLEGQRQTDDGGRRTGSRAALFGSYEGPREAFASASVASWETLFAGRLFDGVEWTAGGGWRPRGALALSLRLSGGDALDAAGARPARLAAAYPRLAAFLGRHVEVTAAGAWERLEVGARELFTATQADLRTVYRFDARLFARATWQWTRVDPGPAAAPSAGSGESGRFAELLLAWAPSPHTGVYLGGSAGKRGGEEEERLAFVKVGWAFGPGAR